MTPKEKAELVDVFEDMFACAVNGWENDEGDSSASSPLGWRAAIDAFERLADHDHEADNVCDILHQVRKLCVRPERDAYDQLEARSDAETITVAQLRTALKGRK